MPALLILATVCAALEYLGELCLELGGLEKAEEQLAAIDDICRFRCEEQRDLEVAIEAHQSTQAAK